MSVKVQPRVVHDGQTANGLIPSGTLSAVSASDVGGQTAVGAGDPAAALICAAFRTAMSRLHAADPEVRHGEPEGIHRLRTSTRRLRSELKTLADLVEPEWSGHLEQELKWIAGLLGGVRDLDILCQRLRAAGSSAGQNGKTETRGCEPRPDDPLAPLFRTLQDRHDEHARALHEALQGERYRALAASLSAAIESPALQDSASQTCRKVLPPLASAAWRQLRKHATDLDSTDPDAQFHEVRKRASGPATPPS